MLVPFTLDGQALAEHAFAPDEVRAAHERMIDLWRMYGLLIFPGEKWTPSELGKAVAELPGDARKLWQEAITLYKWRLRAGPSGWKGFEAASRLTDLDAVEGAVQAAVLSHARATAMGIPPGKMFVRHRSLEVGRYRSADRMPVFQEAIERSLEGISEGVPIKDVWKSHFWPVASIADSMVVVDRFAGSNLLKNGGKSGLAQLLAWLSGMTNIRAIKVICSPQKGKEGREDKPEQYAEALSHYASTWAQAKRVPIALYVPSEPYMRKVAHARWIRFNTTVFEVDLGMELLDGDKTDREFTFAMKPLTRRTREKEELLRSNGRKFEVGYEAHANAVGNAVPAQ
jgi:hypothetical protein